MSTLSGNTVELRIALLGKTGNGKSATGNTIIGKSTFKEDVSASSVTRICEVATGERFGTKIRVIDTPGLFDTHLSEQEIQPEISRCISMASPGPHIFLLVLRFGKFTEEELQAMSKLQEMFGEAATQRTLIVFTGKDSLVRSHKTLQEFISSGDSYLKEIASRYPVIAVDNVNRNDDQVRELINAMKNRIGFGRLGSNYYTKADFSAQQALNDKRQKEKEEEDRRTGNYLQGFRDKNDELGANISAERKKINGLNKDYERNQQQYKRQLVEKEQQKNALENEMTTAIKKRRQEVEELEKRSESQIKNLWTDVKKKQEQTAYYEKRMTREINEVKTEHTKGIRNICQNNEKRLADFTDNMKEKYPGRVIMDGASLNGSPIFTVSFDSSTQKFYMTRNGESRTDCIPGYDRLKIVQTSKGGFQSLYFRDMNGKDCMKLEGWR